MSIEQEFKNTRMLKLDNNINKHNIRNRKIVDIIGKTDPKYAKHMFLRNGLIEKFAMNLGGGLDILEQPVCIHCERPAAWDVGGGAYCFSCNKNIPADKVITVMDYLMEYTKTFSEEQLEILNMLGGTDNEIIK